MVETRFHRASLERSNKVRERSWILQSTVVVNWWLDGSFGNWAKKRTNICDLHSTCVLISLIGSLTSRIQNFNTKLDSVHAMWMWNDWLLLQICNMIFQWLQVWCLRSFKVAQRIGEKWSYSQQDSLNKVGQVWMLLIRVLELSGLNKKHLYSWWMLMEDQRSSFCTLKLLECRGRNSLRWRIWSVNWKHANWKAFN